MCILHRVFGGLETRLGVDDGRLGRRIAELGRVVVGLRDRLRLEQQLAALELRGGVVELGFGDREVRLGLREVVLRDARVDLREQLSLFHVVARLHRHLEDLTRSLRLHAQGQDRLDRARGGRRDHDVAVRHGDLLVQRRRLRLLGRIGFLFDLLCGVFRWDIVTCPGENGRKRKGDGFTVIDDAEVKLVSAGKAKLAIPMRRIRIRRDDGAKGIPLRLSGQAAGF